MIYKINADALFNSFDRTLAGTNAPETVVELSKYASRALEKLVINSGERITRDNLLSFMWIEDESAGSNAGLNNYISELRKAFTDVGLDRNIINTIPRYGFKFDGTVEVAGEQPEEAETIPAAESRKRSSRIEKFFVPSLLIMIFSVAAAGILIFNVEEEDIPMQSTFLFNYDKCAVHSLIPRKMDNESIKALLKKEDVDCTTNNRDVFYSEGRSYSMAYHSTFISACDRTETGKYSECVNMKRVFNQ